MFRCKASCFGNALDLRGKVQVKILRKRLKLSEAQLASAVRKSGNSIAALVKHAADRYALVHFGCRHPVCSPRSRKPKHEIDGASAGISRAGVNSNWAEWIGSLLKDQQVESVDDLGVIKPNEVHEREIGAFSVRVSLAVPSTLFLSGRPRSQSKGRSASRFAM
jgi:hypothetical protein